jgi:hypothetical protein
MSGWDEVVKYGAPGNERHRYAGWFEAEYLGFHFLCRTSTMSQAVSERRFLAGTIRAFNPLHPDLKDRLAEGYVSETED